MPNPPRSVRILLTAEEAYPALERAFLDAQSEIWASFLVFDLGTRLRSVEALKIGKTWFDLIVHTLDRGVALHITLGCVDPIARPAQNLHANRQARQFSAAAAFAKPGAKLAVASLRHPAETGALVRLMAWPYIMSKVFRLAGWLNKQDPARRAAALRDMEGALRHLRVRANDTVAVRLFSLPRLFPAVHHQKLAVIDRSLLYIGGLDLDERRYDTPTHGRTGNQTWHDVQLMIQGPVVAEAQAHLECFRDVTEGRTDPPRTRRLLRTLSRPRTRSITHFGPFPVLAELRAAHVVLMRRARQLIYLESQNFRDNGLAGELADSARDNPDLRLILILPAAPEEVAFKGRHGLDSRFGEAMQARALRTLRRGFGPRLFIGSPAQPRPALPAGSAGPAAHSDRHHGAPLVYVHAKVSIFDETSAIVSSANLNGRSLRWDTEAGVYLTAQNDVLELRHRVMAHWLPDDAGPEAFAPATAEREWRRIAWRNAAAAPAQRRGFLLPHDFAAAESSGQNLPDLPADLV